MIMTTADRFDQGQAATQLRAVWIAETEDGELVAKAPSLDALVDYVTRQGQDPQKMFFRYID